MRRIATSLAVIAAVGSAGDNTQVTPLARLDWRLRYAITAAILAVIFGLFIQREYFAGDSGSADAIAACDLGPRDSAEAAVGAPAPDFALRTVDGETVRLSDYRGKTVVLNFWASWCVPCRREMTEFSALYAERLEAGDFVVLAVDYRPLDNTTDVRRFLDGFAEGAAAGIAFPVLYDTDSGAVAERYGVAPQNARQATLPVSFFIDRNGILRAKVFGPVYGSLLPEKVAATEDAAAD